MVPARSSCANLGVDTTIADMKLTIGTPAVNGSRGNPGTYATVITTLCFPISASSACTAAKPCCSETASTLLLSLGE